VDSFTHMDYYQAGRVPQKHIMHLLAERVGLKEMPVKPLIFLSKEELAEKILPDSGKPWVAIQSIGNSKWTDNKNWGAEKFAKLAELLSPSFSLVQLGTSGDPPLPVQMNLCGKLGVRSVFQVLGQCAGFVGLEGFLMHAATTMSVASVIVYGGFTAPWQTGYEMNTNLYTPVPCAPCWLESRCPYDKKCMEAITPAQVADALTEKLHKGPAMIGKA
jgi:ADP-heptose:LPS heptosyltransferase